MISSDRIIRVYQELADYHDRRQEAPLRDRFLVLAADAALCSGRADEAERLRARLLQLNPHHLLKPYASLAEAAKSPDVQSYIAGLRRTYLPESAEHLLESLKTDRGGEPHPADKAPPAAARRAIDAPKGAGDAPKVYRLQGAGNENQAEPPAQVAPPGTPVATARHAGATPAKRPLPADGPPLPAPPGLPDFSGAEAARGAWLSTALFLLTLAGGLGLAFYVFARPFLPIE
ncbi:MAG TPA: hypothetical protein VG013_26695 [Gemmataceae bacterium]|jgi:hypothetical protein|nr:hypothetical protein [Gemmataceae bacterium]